MRVLFCFFSAWIAFGAPCAGLCGDLYQYRDADGSLVITDDYRQIPEGRPVQRYGTSDPLSAEDLERIDRAREAEVRLQKWREEMELEAEQKEQAKAEEKNRALRETPVTIHGNQVLVPVTLESGGRTRNVTLLLDTGASITLVHSQALEGFPLTNMRQSQGIMASGKRVDMSVGQVSALSIGPYSFSRRDVAVFRYRGSDADHQGLLGMDVLRSVNYRIDYQRSVIVWGR